MQDFDEYIKFAADPAAAANRIENLTKIPDFPRLTADLDKDKLAALINLISHSGLFYRYICRHPDSIAGLETGFDFNTEFANLDELKIYKYQQLLNITWQDFLGKCEYEKILNSISRLADFIFNQVVVLTLPETHMQIVNQHLAAFGMGKLGASELNFSSDIDLIFVCSNTADVDIEIYHYQKVLQDSIRLMSSQLEKKTSEGFFYRVDLKLRPWGRSGPLVMTINETENYYEASSEVWERFAWLRARQIMGTQQLADDLKNRLKSFVYRRSLGEDDLQRFVEIKTEMCAARRKKGYWDVKVGEGGIRDIEFFIQMLQMVNAYKHPELQQPATIKVLNGLKKNELISENEAAELLHSYLFLRKLENRLQMIEEHQTHELPDEYPKRLVIARSMGIRGDSDNEVIDIFESELFANQTIAKNYFDRILPD